MAKSTRQYVFEGMELLPEALVPFVEKRLEAGIGKDWPTQITERYSNLRPNKKGELAWDQAALFNVMDRFWNDAFRTVLGKAERSLINELGDVRNKLSHNDTFTYDDAERALDSMRRLMESISAAEVADNDDRMIRHGELSLFRRVARLFRARRTPPGNEPPIPRRFQNNCTLFSLPIEGG